MPNAFCIVSVTGNNPKQFISNHKNCKKFSCSVSTNRNLIGGLGYISHPESRGATTKLMPVRYFKYGFLSVSEGSDFKIHSTLHYTSYTDILKSIALSWSSSTWVLVYVSRDIY